MGKWQFTAAEMARQQFLLAGAITRMLKRKMSQGWEKWQQVYVDLKFANRMGGGAIRRMLNRKLSMAWEKWQFTAAEMARQQFMLAGALNRMLKRKMSQAWEKWQATYAEVKDAYPVEQWLPSALPHLNSPMKELPALPAGNLYVTVIMGAPYGSILI